jgi:hypothetical protein
MAFFARRVEDVLRAVRKIRRGKPVSTEAQDDIAWLERTIGLKRPLTSYSERSQRRIFQRLREGAVSSKEVYQKEYEARKTKREEVIEEHGLLPSQWRRIEPLRDKLQTYGMDVDPYMDDEVLKEFAELYGYEYLLTVLTEQIESTERYLQGDASLGNRRWNARGQLEERFGASSAVMHIRGTNPYYYYHGRKA